MRRLGVLVLLLGAGAAAACIEQSTAPGACPNFCPGDSITIRDTLFTDVIERDSSFAGYLLASQAVAMTAAQVPGADSRAFFTTDTMLSTVVRAPDTLPLVIDSARMRFSLVRRPRNTTNLRLLLYRLPVTTDSTSDFASLDPAFTAAPVDSVNISTLLQTPGITDTTVIRFWHDSVCGSCIDSVRIDGAGNVLLRQSDSTLTVYFKLDTLEAPFSRADTGRSAWGVRVAADSFASVGLGTIESGGNAALLRWFYHYTIPDTVSATPDSVVHRSKSVPDRFDAFVFSPANAPTDSNLSVGGAPSARALLRVKMPAFLHDTIDVVRATLILVPAAVIPGSPVDSFSIFVRPVLTDLGAKSPLSTNTLLFSSTFAHPGSADTVRIEVTNLVRAWSLDTTLTTAFFLQQAPEASSFAQARFYSTRAPAFKPTLQVTYVNRFEFGKP